jgi:diguanylate cyclase (GGDEF)-like protein
MVMQVVEDERDLNSLLSHIKEDASHNQEVMSRSQQRELDMLGAESLKDLLVRMTEGLRESCAVDEVRLILLDPCAVWQGLLNTMNLDSKQFPGLRLLDNPRRLPPGLIDEGRPQLGPWWPRRHAGIFQQRLGSVALVPMRRKDGFVGLIGLGSRNPHRFTTKLATDFLQRLGAIGAICLENAFNREQLRLTSLTDPLTGLYNRRYLEQRLAGEVARAQRHRQPLSFLFVDADHFKRVNDTYGHDAGDRVLVHLGAYLKRLLRASDIAVRYGGEEFAMVLPQTTLNSAHELAERIRRAIAAHPARLDSGEAIHLTLSIGVSGTDGRWNLAPESVAIDLIRQADKAVYTAKEAGRNRVMLGR